jgi:hypothetical protein
MAQHRTKDDKMKAQVRRMEQAKTYSLSDLGQEKMVIKQSSKVISETFGVNMKAIKSDLLRTAFATSIIVALLAVGFVLLR